MDTVSQYFTDVMDTVVNGVLSPKLKEHLRFKDVLLESTKYVVTKEWGIEPEYGKIIALFVFDHMDDIESASDEMEYSFLINEDTITCIIESGNNKEHINIENKEDFFNISVRCNINLSFEHLKLIQTYFNKLPEKMLYMYYSIGEEKFYGY